MRRTTAGPGLARQAADIVEALFGPDPGLLRLQKAGRSVLSATLTLLALLLPEHGGFMPVAGVALGFMVSIFGSMMVRSSDRGEQALTFLLLAVPPLPTVAFATFLSRWQWAMDIGFVALVVGVTLAREAGPRGMAMGMTAFISYFIGAIIHPNMAQLPLIALAVAVGVGIAALVRFLILPDAPRFTLHHAARHIERRIGRILDTVQAHLETEEAVHFGTRPYNRLHREMARLNDAILTAEGEAGSLPGAEDGRLRPVSRALFRIDLAAERVIRTASFRPPPARQRQAARRRVAALQARLGPGNPPSRHHTQGLPPQASAGRLGDAVDALEDGLMRLRQAIMEAVSKDRPRNNPVSEPNREGREPTGRDGCEPTGRDGCEPT